MSINPTAEFKKEAKGLGPEAIASLENIRASAGREEYEPLAKFITDLGTEITPGQVKNFVLVAKMPIKGPDILAAMIASEAGRPLKGEDVALFKDLGKATNPEIITLIAKIKGILETKAVVADINEATGGTAPVTQPETQDNSADAAADTQPGQDEQNSVSAPPPSGKPVTSLTGVAGASFAGKPDDAAGEVKKLLDSIQAEKKEQEAQAARAEQIAREKEQVGKIMEQVRTRQGRAAEQAGGLLALALGNIENIDFETALNSAGMQEARQREVKIVDGEVGLLHMASFFMGKGPLSVPLSMVEAVKDRMLTEFAADPMGSLDKLSKALGQEKGKDLERLKTALQIAESNSDTKQAAEILSGLTEKAITEKHVLGLKNIMNKQEKDNGKILETLLDFDISVNQKLDEQAAMIGGGMIRQYLSNPSMLIDQIIDALAEFLPDSFADTIKSAGHTVKNAFASFGFGSGPSSA